MTENIRKGIIEFVQAYCIATTATVFVCAVFNSIFFRGALLQHGILWQILLLCFVCSLCNFIHPCEETNRKRILLNIGMRYLYINLVVWGGGHIFRWSGVENGFMLAVMMLEILLVSILVSAITWEIGKKESERLNRKLQEYQSAGAGISEEVSYDLQTKFPVDKL